jgi:hypothetical protein
MIIGYAWVSTTKQNLGLRHDDVKPAFDASVDQTDARNTPAGEPSSLLLHNLAELHELPDVLLLERAGGCSCQSGP